MVATFRIKGTEKACGNFDEETFLKSATWRTEKEV
jgi:hypothetical protein